MNPEMEFHTKDGSSRAAVSNTVASHQPDTATEHWKRD